MVMLDGTEFFECSCGSDEHTLRFILDFDSLNDGTDSDYPPYPEIYTSVFLNHYDAWYRRLWRGIKYIFGYKSKHGHFDSFSMRPGDIPRFREMLDKFEEGVKNSPYNRE